MKKSKGRQYYTEELNIEGNVLEPIGVSQWLREECTSSGEALQNIRDLASIWAEEITAHRPKAQWIKFLEDIIRLCDEGLDSYEDYG